jgi:iron complex transport system permease protein
LGTLTIAVMIGPVSIRPGVVWRVALDNLVTGWISPTWQPFEASIAWEVRLPRVVLATVVGAGLAVVGAALQALVRNPLADPYLLGTSA